MESSQPFYSLTRSSVKLQSLNPFYEGKTINLIVSTSPGGATDVAGRLVSRYLGKYIPGHPNILAQNMAGAGGIVSANYLSTLPSRMA